MTHALNRCGLITPFWVALGWVHWTGTPERERQWMIEYRRCERAGAPVDRKDLPGAFL